MSQGAKRTWYVPTDPETGAVDRERALELLANLEGTLFEVGGMVNIATERVQIGELAGKPVAVTSALIVEWQAFSPMVRADQPPAPAEDELELEDELEDEPEPVEA